VIRRRRLIFETLQESLSVSNYSGRTVRFELRIELGADFHDIFEVRGFVRQSRRPQVTAEAQNDRVTYTYHGVDGATRTCHVRFSLLPSQLRPEGAVFHLEIEPRGTVTIDTRVGAERIPVEPAFPRAVSQVQEAERAFLDGMTEIRTDNERLNDTLRRALLDIASLQTASHGETYIAAGVPWFDTLFGRDSLITGMLMTPFNPGLLRATLLLLAKFQAEETDMASDATPGKIPHELRWGELAQAGEVPFGRYYGSVDSTPLFLMAAGEYLAWTDDDETLRELLPALQRARDWCAVSAPRGWLSYERASAIGLENQGWKDSHDALVWPDGTFVAHPIALVEVQGYLVAGLMAFARILEALGKDGADEVRAEADDLKNRLEQAFAVEGHGYAFCLDGNLRPVPTSASNQGHLLWCGAASEQGAREVAERLVAPDMFSGWGVRTLSTDVGAYNPLGYHTGSVWPHDNAIIVGGLRRYGFDDEAQRIATALIEAGLAFANHQVPELFSGDERALRLVPTPYPVASRPQAWSAASLPHMVTALLGIRPHGRSRITIVRPILPDNVAWVEVRNLQCQGGCVDLTFRRQGDHASVEVARIRGNMEVVLVNQ
jgi:glycogen debranching enzyme